MIATGFDEADLQSKPESLKEDITGNINNTGIMPSQTAQTTPIGVNTVTNESLAEKEHVDNIDIPAFLRQQAD